MDCSVSFQVMVSQVWPQEGTQETDKETTCIIFTGPQEEVTTSMQGHGIEPDSVKMTGDRLQGKVWAAAIIGVSEGKAKEGREEFRIG